MTHKVKPGAAAAALGLRGIDLAERQISPTNIAGPIDTQAVPLRIIVTPTANAIVCSIALQFGADVETIRKALCRDARGNASGPLGVALDILARGNE